MKNSINKKQLLLDGMIFLSIKNLYMNIDDEEKVNTNLFASDDIIEIEKDTGY